MWSGGWREDVWERGAHAFLQHIGNIVQTSLREHALDLGTSVLLRVAQVFGKVAEVLPGLLVTLCTCLLLYYIYRSRGLPPGPWGLPVVGFLPWLDPDKPHITLSELSQEYGPIYSLRLGEVPAVVLSHPALVREALARDVFTGRAPLWLTHGLMDGNGLIAVEGEKWREQRKFVVSSLRNLGAVRVGGKRALMEARILEAVRSTCMMLEEAEGAVDPHKPLAHNLGNLMNLLIFGTTFGPDDETWLWLQHLAEEGVKLVGVAGLLNFLPALRFLPKYSRILKFVKDGQLRTHELYRELARSERPSSVNFLSMFLASAEEGRGKYFSDQQMVHLLADMFGAGLDTSLATLRWFLLYMALHPQEQERVQEEIDNSLGDKDLPNLDDLQRCPFTEAAILETMRIRPVVPLGIPHGTLEDTSLAGYKIPAGTMLIVNQWALHHDADHWTEPEAFNPRRFLATNGSIRKSEYFNPFQNGKRVCVGEELARMVLLLFAGGVLRRFRVEVGEAGVQTALEGCPGITLSPGPHRLLFSRRQ